MISTLLIDDEPLARSLLNEYLEDFPQIKIMQECNDGFEGLKAIMQYRPQLIFLDIQMPKINGFEMLELIDEPPAVIFVTAFDEYAIKAFEQHAIDYLLKPFSKERFAKAVSKFLEHSTDQPFPSQATYSEITVSPQQRQRIVVKNAGKIKIIPVEEVQYIEAADDYVKICTREGSFLKNRTMTHFTEILDPSQFVRTHRSFIVNVQHITRIEPYEKENHLAILKEGGRIPVSKTGYGKLKEVLGL
jgi:two-component system LytT family response regulator